MKILYISMVSVLISTGISFAQSSGKIGYIDLQRVILESKAGKTAKAAFAREFNQKAQVIEQKKKALDRDKDNFLKQAAAMNEDARLRKAEEIQKREKELNRTRDDYRDELQKRDIDFSKEILTKVIEIVNKIGTSEGYVIIVEKTEGGVLCCKGADLTERITQAAATASASAGRAAPALVATKLCSPAADSTPAASNRL